MEPLDDTIAAVSTPAGSSPVAIVRLSGPEALPILQSLLAEPPCEVARTALLRSEHRELDAGPLENGCNGARDPLAALVKGPSASDPVEHL